MKAKKTNLQTTKGRQEAAAIIKQLWEISNRIDALYDLDDNGEKDSHLGYRAQQAALEFGDKIARLQNILEETTKK